MGKDRDLSWSPSGGCQRPSSFGLLRRCPPIPIPTFVRETNGVPSLSPVREASLLTEVITAFPNQKQNGCSPLPQACGHPVNGRGGSRRVSTAQRQRRDFLDSLIVQPNLDIRKSDQRARDQPLAMRRRETCINHYRHQTGGARLAPLSYFGGI